MSFIVFFWVGTHPHHISQDIGGTPKKILDMWAIKCGDPNPVQNGMIHPNKNILWKSAEYTGVTEIKITLRLENLQ